VGPGPSDNQRADEDGEVGKSVAEIVNQDAAQIEVAAPSDQGQSDAAVHGQSGDRGPNHPALDDFDGRAEALDGFISQPKRKQHEDEGVGERGQRAGAMIAVGFLAVGGAFRPSHCQITDA